MNIVKTIVKWMVFLIVVASKISGAEAPKITDQDVIVFKVPYDSYNRVTTYCMLKKSKDPEDFKAGLGLLESQIISDIGYLNYIIENHGDRSAYAKYVLCKIVVGIKYGYISVGDSISSKSYMIMDEKEWSVNISEIYNSVIVSEEIKTEFLQWFKKFGVEKRIEK